MAGLVIRLGLANGLFGVGVFFLARILLVLLIKKVKQTYATGNILAH